MLVPANHYAFKSRVRSWQLGNLQALAAAPAPAVEKRAAEWAPLFLAFAASKHGAADDDAEADADRAAGQPGPVAAVSRVGGRCSPEFYSSPCVLLLCQFDSTKAWLAAVCFPGDRAQHVGGRERASL